MFSSGTVTLQNANGVSVPLVSGGTINANGNASITYNANVAYPLIVGVTGTYYNEVTGTAETSTAPLRGIITNTTAASSNVPVTIVTETAVAILQNRTGTISSSNPATSASAKVALSVAGAMLGISAAAVPAFNPVTNLISDANTIQLAALSVVANSQVGTTLVDRINTLAIRLATLGNNAPTTIISQAAYNQALASITSGILSILAPGATIPPGVTIAIVSFDRLYASIILYYPLQWSFLGGIMGSYDSWDLCTWQ